MSEDYKVTKEKIQGYQSLVDTLLWLVLMTRPDISFAVGKCSRYSSSQISSKNVAMNKIVQYLKQSKKLSFRYNLRFKSNDWKLLGYTDTSYGNCFDTRCLTSIYSYLLGNGLISSWSDKCQATVPTLTAETKYVEECNTAKN